MTNLAPISDLPLLYRGKVRDIYELGDDRLLMVASDRLSAFDVVLPTAIPGKGIVLTQLSRFWFDQLRELIPNHLIAAPVDDFPPELARLRAELAGRSMIVRKAERIDVECVVRAYLAGSAWAEYQRQGTVASVRMPAGLRNADRLPEAMFTPAIKRDQGHDESISRERLVELVGQDLADRLAQTSLSLYNTAAELAEQRGIIIADTKFEFGWIDGELTLIDEALTPDSSRFWDRELYQPGVDQPSLDKQPVRDWLERSGWKKQPPGPELPADVVAATVRRYETAFERLTGSLLPVIAEHTVPTA